MATKPKSTPEQREYWRKQSAAKRARKLAADGVIIPLDAVPEGPAKTLTAGGQRRRARPAPQTVIDYAKLAGLIVAVARVL